MVKLKYVFNQKREIPQLGVFAPGDVVEVEDEEKARVYLKTGYFVEEKKRKGGKNS